MIKINVTRWSTSTQSEMLVTSNINAKGQFADERTHRQKNNKQNDGHLG